MPEEMDFTDEQLEEAERIGWEHGQEEIQQRIIADADKIKEKAITEAVREAERDES